MYSFFLSGDNGDTTKGSCDEAKHAIGPSADVVAVDSP